MGCSIYSDSCSKSFNYDQGVSTFYLPQCLLTGGECGLWYRPATLFTNTHFEHLQKVLFVMPATTRIRFRLYQSKYSFKRLKGNDLQSNLVENISHGISV